MKNEAPQNDGEKKKFERLIEGATHSDPILRNVSQNDRNHHVTLTSFSRLAKISSK